MVPSNSFQTDVFLTTVPAVCNKTYFIALLPFLQQHERLSACDLSFTFATDKQTSKTKKCPCHNSAACSNVCNFYHHEVQGVRAPCVLGVKLRQVLAEQPGRAGPSCAQPRRRGAWLGLQKDGIQPGLAWMLEIASDQIDWKWLCCRGVQRLKARARLSSTLILLCWPTPPMRWPGLGREWLHADKSSRGSRIGCAKGHCSTPSIYPLLVLCAVTFVCNKYNPWSPGQMDCPLYCCGETFLALHQLSMQTERSRCLYLL